MLKTLCVATALMVSTVALAKDKDVPPPPPAESGPAEEDVSIESYPEMNYYKYTVCTAKHAEDYCFYKYYPDFPA